MTDKLEKPVKYANDSAAITTSHTIRWVRVARTGKIYIANVTVKLTSNVAAWTTLFTLKDVTIATSQYIYGNVNGTTAALFYIGTAGNVSGVSGFSNGDEIKIAIPLVLE